MEAEQTNQKKQSKAIYWFFGKAALLYLLWMFVFAPMNAITTALHSLLIENIVFVGVALLKALNYTVFYINSHIWIAGSAGVLVGEACDGLDVFFLYIAFFLAYPGSTRKKIAFILSGTLLIHVLNYLRVVALALIQYYAPQHLDFNHKYTFTYIIYTVIFILWYSFIQQKNSKPEA